MSTKSYNKPIPKLDDPEMGPFWRNARQRVLSAQKCAACGALRFPALPICPECLQVGSDWVPVSPRGKIWSYAVYHRAFHPGFKDEIPYVVAIVENEDGVRYTGRLQGAREQIAVGADVEVRFVDETEEFTLPQWAIVASGS
jgi:uncharacterized OB-fold protein